MLFQSHSMHVNPSAAVMEAISVAVPLNNEAHDFRKRGDFAGAERRFLESLRIKLRAYPENSVHICISLSGIAETYLEWAATGGERASSRLAAARSYAERMRAAAAAIRDAGQLKYAHEILADIAKAEGGKRVAPDPAHDTLATTVTAVASAGGGVSFTLSQPTRRCYSPVCPRAGVAGAGVALKMCGKCKRVYYCNADCQRAAWKDHKPFCEKTED